MSDGCVLRRLSLLAFKSMLKLTPARVKKHEAPGLPENEIAPLRLSAKFFRNDTRTIEGNVASVVQEVRHGSKP
jgi:hypothetical protein